MSSTDSDSQIIFLLNAELDAMEKKCKDLEDRLRQVESICSTFTEPLKGQIPDSAYNHFWGRLNSILGINNEPTIKIEFKNMDYTKIHDTCMSCYGTGYKIKNTIFGPRAPILCGKCHGKGYL